MMKDGGLSDDYVEILNAYDNERHSIEIFMDGVAKAIGEHPDLVQGDRRIVHSYKSRLKDREHLRKKIRRKNTAGNKITSENLFDEVTDLAGVRILHLFQEDFGSIDKVIRKRISDGDWILIEPATAYTWDPEAVTYFKDFDLKVIKKDSSYTSVHYVIRPRANSPQCCEIQVRTLFEEIWGEVDHQINYPVATDILACKEQIMVLSKIVGAGSRLLDSLRRTQDS